MKRIFHLNWLPKAKIGVVTFFVSSVLPIATHAEGSPVYLHWFTFDEDQNFILIESREIEFGEEIDSNGLRGKLIRDSRGIHATLAGSYGSSRGSFRNYIEIDRSFSPACYIFSGGIHATRFLVSRISDPEKAYEAASAKADSEAADSDYEIDLSIPLMVDPEH